MWRRIDGDKCWGLRSELTRAAVAGRSLHPARQEGPVVDNDPGRSRLDPQLTTDLATATIDAVGNLFLRQEPVFDDPFKYVPTPTLDSGVLVLWKQQAKKNIADLTEFWQPPSRNQSEEARAEVMTEPDLLVDWSLVTKYMGEMLAFFGTMFLVGWVISPALSQRLWRGY